MSERKRAAAGVRSWKGGARPRSTVQALRDSPKPVIAAVNGAARRRRMNLALCATCRLASTAAKFAQRFVRRGLHPDWGGTYFLSRVGRHREGLRADLHR